MVSQGHHWLSPAVEAVAEHIWVVGKVVEDVDELRERRSFEPVVLPAVQHQRVEDLGTHTRWRKPVAGLDQCDHLCV